MIQLYFLGWVIFMRLLDDAVITSQVLGIVLTKRANGKAADVNLAGFPIIL